MNDLKELSASASLYDAIPLIIQHECVVIRDGTGAICGIVTPADLSVQFRDLAEPFARPPVSGPGVMRVGPGASETLPRLPARRSPPRPPLRRTPPGSD